MEEEKENVEKERASSQASSTGCRIKVRYEQNAPPQYISGVKPFNVSEMKDRFLRRKITPEFRLALSAVELENALLSETGKIKFHFFAHAKRILDTVMKNFQTLDIYIEESFGHRISIEDATEKIIKYVNDESLPTPLEVIWCEDLLSSALMCSTKVDEMTNKEVTRKYTMLLKTNAENTYLRDIGVLCLMDHEIGTHYHRSYNEGLQPWYRKRSEYGLSSLGSHEMTTTEEGFACINTSIGAKNHYLAVPALLYYGACMAEYLPFKELFEHLSKYVKDEEQCWKHCMRIKRCVRNQEECGGYGKDQRYFEGAVRILMEQNNIDFRQLIAAKLSLKDLEKVQEHITLAEVHFPSFMRPYSAYQAKLREIARLNGLAILPKREPVKPPAEPPPLPEVVEIVKNVTRTGPAKPKSDRQKGNLKGVREINTPNVGKPTPRRAQKVIEPPVDDDDIRLQQCSRLLKNLSSLALLPVDAMPHNQHFAFHTPEHREIVDITPNDVIARPSMLKGSEDASWKPATAYLDFKQNEQTSPFAKNPRVCGCSLFLYGRLSSNRQFTAAEGDAILPVVLELDLRHPILDTMH